MYLKEPHIPGGICLVDATQWIELHYYGENHTHCPALRRIIEQSISKVAEILHLPHMATPQLGFICNGLICDVIEDRHICTHDQTEGTHEVTCSIGVYTKTVIKERKLCWLISQEGKFNPNTMHKVMYMYTELQKQVEKWHFCCGNKRVMLTSKIKNFLYISPNKNDIENHKSVFAVWCAINTILIYSKIPFERLVFKRGT